MTIIDKALKHIWYPGARMEDYQDFKPQQIKRAYGSYIELKDGRKIIDAISSWWCKSLGHANPRLKQAMIEQMNKFEHVMQPHMIHETIAELSEKLAHLTKTLSKVFYASDGSTAVEIAIKMALHAQKNLGRVKRNKFIALSNGYHGETIGTLSVSDLGKYTIPYQDLMFTSKFIDNIPYVLTTADPLWEDCSKNWQQIEIFLESQADNLAAIILEPIVQGSGGMLIYSKDFLKRLSNWTKKHQIYLIADEIMTGIGRTGKMLACNYAEIEPDFLCLSKGLTSGILPLSVMITSNEIYDVFYRNDPFLHSNTHYGNALAASVALEVLKIFEEEKIYEEFDKLNMLTNLQEIADQTSKIKNVRGIGAIAAADLVDVDGFKLYKKAMELGAILRPIGKTIYWLPPLNISAQTLKELKAITKEALLVA